MAKIEGTNYWKDRPYRDQRLDWRGGEVNWIEGYRKSITHPHRDLVIKAVDGVWPITSLCEIGCNAGPNLYRLRQTFRVYDLDQLAGIDINKDSIAEAKSLNPDADLKVGDIRRTLPFADDSFDCVLSDAVLMYITPKSIKKVLAEADRITKKAIIIIDWYDKSKLGVIKDHHWARNFPRLLRDLGYKVTTTKLDNNSWPSEIWQRNGRLFVATK